MEAGKPAEKVGPIQTPAPAPKVPSQKLMVRGSFRLATGDRQTVELVRGMTVRTNEGQVAGKVAAVVVNAADGQVSHLLLCRLPRVWDYRQVPVSLIHEITGETVILDVPESVIETLARKERVP